MVLNEKRDLNVLTVTSDDQTSAGLRLFVGDRELECLSFKLGTRDDDGTVRNNELLTATIEVPVRFGK